MQELLAENVCNLIEAQSNKKPDKKALNSNKSFERWVWKFEFQGVPEKRAQVQICRQETATSRLCCNANISKENWDELQRSRWGRLSAHRKRIEMKSWRTSGWRDEGEIWSSERSHLFNFPLSATSDRVISGFGDRELDEWQTGTLKCRYLNKKPSAVL